MNKDSDKIKETITDLESCKETILERHSNDKSLCLRFDSVFRQLINSLNYTTSQVQSVGSKFEPKPLNKVMGTKINVKAKSEKLVLKPLQVDAVKSFKEKINAIYESFTSRENPDLLEALEEVEIRGVAKIAGVPDFEKAKVDSQFIDVIKKAIDDKADTTTKKEDLKIELKVDESKKVEDAPTKPIVKVEPVKAIDDKADTTTKKEEPKAEVKK